MKNLLLFLLILVTISCNENLTNYSITAKIDGLKKGDFVQIIELEDNSLFTVIDSFRSNEDGFTYKGFTDYPKQYYLQIENKSTPIFIEQGNIVVEGYLMSNNFHITGTPSNEGMTKLIDFKKGYEKHLMSASKDSVETAKIQLEEYRSSFIKENSSSYAALYAVEMLLGNPLNIRLVENLYTIIIPEIRNTKEAKRIEKMILQIKQISIGNPAHDFSAPTPNGDILKLSTIKGRITIVDFWASWCAPCRLQNPHLVELYKAYHNKGLEIIGVSLDKEKKQWLGAIESDGLDWHQVSNLKFWQEPIASLYNVRSIPATFILDENMIIKLINPSIEEVEHYIQQILSL